MEVFGLLRGHSADGQSTDMKRIRVIIVGDHELIRSAFHAALETEEDLHVVGETPRDAAAALMRRVDADVVLVDLTMPETRGLETLRTLKRQQPELPVLVLMGEGGRAGLAIEAGRQAVFATAMTWEEWHKRFERWRASEAAGKPSKGTE